ncbi:BON domain-containing protein [Comamonas flocculans]|uniref:BON domain-containing protein n=1 Tax=Comamonas flocculans TaxID=2597701 RepID=A0A5B8RVG3_9BURK|nr:BON domain-containing protein [Comamonas flocculans]QEA12654.1 BON domain-containing protein [Comamonas flocculans]
MTLRFSSLLRIVLVGAGLASALSACVPLVVGTGAAVGAMVATDPRTTGTQLEDEGIELRASSQIRDTLGDRVHVNITSYSRQVLITGEVPTEADKQRVQNIVREVANVKSVVNALGIMPNSSLSERSNDTYITGKVRAKLIDLNDLVATNAFKVVTERGEVFLMGHVTQYQAAQLTEATRSIDGVRKVVRVFEIVPGSAAAPAASPAAAPAPVTSPAESGGVTITPIPATNIRTEN